LTVKTEKASIRKVFLQKRDSTSYDLIKISSQQLHKNLKKIVIFKNAKNIACYYPIGSEVKTENIIQEALDDGKEVSLPKVVNGNLIFKKITGIKNLDKGSYGILEPKDNCPEMNKVDVVLVPTIAITRSGIRLGYGYGYYDRYLSTTKAKTISLTFAKQITKTIPSSDNDVKIEWVVTEDEYFKTSVSN